MNRLPVACGFLVAILLVLVTIIYSVNLIPDEEPVYLSSFILVMVIIFPLGIGLITLFIITEIPGQVYDRRTNKFARKTFSHSGKYKK